MERSASVSNDEVKSFLSRWARAYDEGDETFFTSFSKDASIFTISSPTRIDGLEEFRRGFEPYFGQGTRRSQILSPEIKASGDTAVATFHNRVNVDNRVTNMRTTVVLARGDRDLEIVHLHQSPLSSAAAAGGAAPPETVSLLEERVATAAAAVGTPK